MGIMLVAAGSGASSMMSTLRMKEAMESISNSMDHGRQLAMTSNRDVVFRIYKFTNDMNQSNWRSMEFGTVDIETNPDATGYQDPTGTNFKPKFKAAGAPTILADGMVFHPSTSYSSLLDTTKTELITGSDTGPDGRARDYVSFRFLPDGRTSLGTGTKWSLTLIRESEATGAALPANFATMQLDPATARVRTFRP